MADHLGQGAAIGLGRQSAWVTAVSRTVWMPVLSTGLARKIKRVRRETLAHGATFNARKSYTESDGVSGTTEVLGTYQGLGLLLEAALGSVATTGPSSSLYTHTFSMAAALLAGLSIEVQRGTGLSELFIGMKVNKLTLKIEAGKELRVSVDWIGRTASAATTAVSPTYTTSRDYVVEHFEAGALLFNSVAYAIDSLELVIDNKLTTRQSLGSALAAEINRSGMTEITLKLGLTDNSTDGVNWETAHFAGTESDAVVTFTSQSSVGDTFTVNANKCFVDDVSAPINAIGPIKRTVTLVTQADATDEGLKIIIVNAQSSAIAA